LLLYRAFYIAFIDVLGWVIRKVYLLLYISNRLITGIKGATTLTSKPEIFFKKAKTLQFFLRNKEESLKKLIISLYGYIKKNNKET